jgi:hypothetical protein
MAKRKAKIDNRALTTKLREMAAEVHDVEIVDEETGEIQVITRIESLATKLWNRALGWIEEVVEEDDDVPGKVRERKIVHKPEQWAMQLLYDRLEGRVPQALPDDGPGITAADKVGELAKSKINSMAKKAAGDERPPPPTFRRKKDGGDA